MEEEMEEVEGEEVRLFVFVCLSRGVSTAESHPDRPPFSAVLGCRGNSPTLAVRHVRLPRRPAPPVRC